ncbi:glyoxalase superfamily protein [Luteolibacter sp. LG18]|uniref:glyoxalase superfamily protein n=1 Tax=Luteolibacter sp. LG18 TaxID=2819286 RepID=UPI002B2AD711|nr:bleomycin resistance protein [Luteolibacter sp. LG18]
MNLGPVTPILRIFDEEKAHEFYVGFLGFQVDWQHRFDENAPLYQQVSRDGCILHLSGHFGDACPGSAVRIETAGVTDFQTALLAKCYKHARPGLEKTDWGTLEVRLTDPFGNRLTFFENVPG